jgi:hypothetical protein
MINDGKREVQQDSRSLRLLWEKQLRQRTSSEPPRLLTGCACPRYLPCISGVAGIQISRGR